MARLVYQLLAGVGHPLLDLLRRHSHDPVVLLMHPLTKSADGMSGEPVKASHAAVSEESPD